MHKESYRANQSDIRSEENHGYISNVGEDDHLSHDDVGGDAFAVAGDRREHNDAANTDDLSVRNGAERCVRLYAEDAETIEPGEIIPKGKHVNLNLESSGQKEFNIEIEKDTKIGLFAQHTAEGFNMKLIEVNNNDEVPVEIERTWVAQHEHMMKLVLFQLKKMEIWMNKNCRLGFQNYLGKKE